VETCFHSRGSWGDTQASKGRTVSISVIIFCYLLSVRQLRSLVKKLVLTLVETLQQALWRAIFI